MGLTYLWAASAASATLATRSPRVLPLCFLPMRHGSMGSRSCGTPCPAP